MINDWERWLMCISVCTHWALISRWVNQPEWRYLTVAQAWRKLRGR